MLEAPVQAFQVSRERQQLLSQRQVQLHTLKTLPVMGGELSLSQTSPEPAGSGKAKALGQGGRMENPQGQGGDSGAEVAAAGPSMTTSTT